MAPAAQGRCRMGARRPLRQPRTRGTSQRSSAPANPEGSSSLPMIGRRLPASSSFVLAAARLRALQLDPGPRDGTNRRRQGKATTTVTLTRPPKLGHRARPPRSLDSNGPHGCDDARNLCLLSSGGHRGGLSFGPQMVSVDRARIPAADWIGPEFPPCTAADMPRGRDPGGSLSVQVEALVQADVPVKRGAGFSVSGRAAEPMRTPPKRAPCWSRLFPADRQPKDRITSSDQEVQKNAHRGYGRLVALARLRSAWPDGWLVRVRPPELI